MESSPLSLAHSHARNASAETSKANPIAASEEHDLAAGEFANAARGTADAEALRTLWLLECHHQKLAELLKTRPADTHQTSSGTASVTLPSLPLPVSEASKPTKSLENQATVHIPPSLHLTHRDLSSSIASNLASARGIQSGRQRRGNQSPAQLSPQNAEGRVVNPQRRSKLGGHEIRVSSPADINESKKVHKPALPPAQPRATGANLDHGHYTPSVPQSLALSDSTTDDTFSRFYATFGNLISTLSAPLAFAGLPLNLEPTPSLPARQTTSAQSLSPTSSRAIADPDLTRIFSRAALHAVRDGNGGFGGVESFYVVPTTGGTMSYAGMLSHARRGPNLTEDDEAEFVDASETPQTTFPSSQRRHPGNSRRLRGRGSKTIEELETENESLRAVTVDFADRLRIFELGAQRSSIALHASIRAISSPTGSISQAGKIPPTPSQANTIKVLEEKIRAMEDELKMVKKENKRLVRENQKFVSVIERYRERWEMLKVGARERVKGGVSDD